jgi:aspartate kinase
MIVQNMGRNGLANMTFTVPLEDVNRAQAAVSESFASDGDGVAFEVSEIAKLSVVGVGMRSHAGVAAELFAALAEGGVNIELVSTSEIKISVGITRSDAQNAARLAHAAFGLEQSS